MFSTLKRKKRLLPQSKFLYLIITRVAGPELFRGQPLFFIARICTRFYINAGTKNLAMA